MQRSFRTLAPILLALALFLVNSLTPMRDAMAVLYTLVVMLVADAGGRRLIAATGIGCCLLAVLSFLIKHSGEAPDGAYVRLAVSLTAIAVATVLAVRARQARTRLAEQIGLLAATHDTVIVRDPGDIILEWNEGATRLYGWSREEAIGRSAAQLLQTRYREGAPPRLSPGGRWSGEIARQRRDGTPVPLSSRWIGRLDENGRAAGIIELSADLTEQRVAEQASARSQRRYAAIFHGAGMPILEACLSPPAEGRTRRLTVRDGNQAAARLLAVEPAALPGLELLERLPSAGAETLDAALARLSRGEATIELSCTLVDSHGRMRDVVLTISRTDGEDASDVVLLTALDVTEREAALHRIERLRVDLWHAARLSTLGQMTASIAHEVNQPVQATMNFARSAQLWLQRTPPELDEAAHCLQRIVDTSERAGRVVDRVRAMSRREPPLLVPLDLAELATEALAILESELRSHAVAVEAGDLGRPSPVRGDRTQLLQVMVNVLLNAIQAMATLPQARRRLRLTIADETAHVALHVDDDGPGFAPDRLAQAFDPFQGDKASGFGIGLSVCRTILDAHEGLIAVGNRADGGAHVSIRLPSA
jgi:PAS domain S-box-containing protein